MARLRDKKNKTALNSDDIKLNNKTNYDAEMHQSFVDYNVQNETILSDENHQNIDNEINLNSSEDDLLENSQTINAIPLSNKGEKKKNGGKNSKKKNTSEKSNASENEEEQNALTNEDYKKIEELMQNPGLYEKSSQQSSETIEEDDSSVVDVALQELSKDGNKNFRLSKKTAKRHDSSNIKKSAKPKKVVKKSFKQRMKTLGVLIVLGVFTGSGLGVWYFNSVLRPNVNYDDYIISDYVVTANEVLESTFGISTNQENWLEDIRTAPQYEQYKDYTPLNLSPAQNFILAEYNATLANTFHAVGNGKVETIATQSVYSEKNYDGNRYTFESISKGPKPIAICSAMNKGANTVELYSGSDIQPDDAVWGEPEVYSDDEYTELAGSTPDAIQPYIISDKTILSQTEVIYDEETGYYSFTVELDPVTSVLRYARQVQQTSGLSRPPEFDSVTQTITIDGDWNIISLDIRETYSVVVMGVPADCVGTLTTYYYFNVDDVVLPV